MPIIEEINRVFDEANQKELQELKIPRIGLKKAKSLLRGRGSKKYTKQIEDQIIKLGLQ